MFKEIEKVIYNNVVELFDFVAASCYNGLKILGLDTVDLYGSNMVNLSNGATAISEKIFYVYHTIMFVEMGLLIAICWLILWTFINFNDTYFNSGKTLKKYNVTYSLYKDKEYFTSKVVEFLWTLLPIVVLLYIGYPSLVLLYLVEERIHPEVIIKVVGHQWYWSYENDCGHSFFVDFFTQVDTVSELYDYIRFGLTYNVRFVSIYPFQTYNTYKLGDRIHVMDSATEWEGLIYHSILDGVYDIVTTASATIDSMNMLWYCFATYGWGLMNYVTLARAINDTEFFAANVLLDLTYLEVLAEPVRGFSEISRDATYSYIYGDIEKIFVPFAYKYYWLAEDWWSDYVRAARHETGCNNELYMRTYFDRESFDSYLIKGYDELFPGEKRLLEVDNRLYLPARTHIQLLVTSADVIHAFAVPSFGIKIDAIPGRLNQCFIFAKYEGTFFGQCSELCGLDHGYMPIVIEVVSYSYYSWSIRTLFGVHDDVYYRGYWDNFSSY